MKKVLSIMALTTVMMFTGKTSAQITLHAGYQNASVSAWNYYESVSKFSGFYTGATYNYDLGMANLFVSPGAEFRFLKYKTIDQYDIRIHLWGKWNYSFTDDMAFGIFAGPTAEIGIGGKAYESYENSGANMNGFMLGITLGGEFKFNKVGIEFGYYIDVLNRAKDNQTMDMHALFAGLNYSL